MAGAAVFNNYHVLHKGSWCEVSVAIDDVEGVSRSVLRQIFEYPFKQLGVSRLASGNGGYELALPVVYRAFGLQTRGPGSQGARWRDGRGGILDDA